MTETKAVTITTYRDTVRRLSPTWLRTGRAEKLLYSIAAQIDTLGDMLVGGLKLRFPGVYSYESLPYLGRDRRIRRGRSEPSANYATRLQRWLTDHRRRGSGIALLQQLFIHYAPNTFPIDLVYKNGRRYRMDVDGNITRDTVTVTPTAQWARWSLYYFTDQFPDPLTDDDRNDLLLIPKEWIAGHAIGKIILMRTGSELWDYHSPPRTWNNASLWDKPPVTIVTVGI
jgi:hypothetical protein